MSRDAARAVCLDASVLVKIWTVEPHSDKVKQWVAGEAGVYTTTFCFYEALNVLKSKWKYQGRLSAEEYRSASSSLVAWFGGVQRAGFVKDADLTSPAAFRWVRDLVAQTGLDFSDAYQIYSVKHGYFSVLAGESRTVLATTDAQLAQVARTHDLRVINLAEDLDPS